MTGQKTQLIRHLRKLEEGKPALKNILIVSAEKIFSRVL